MEIATSLLVILGFGPIAGLAVVFADSRSGGRALNARRMMVAATLGGMLSIAPLSCMIFAGSHGFPPVLPFTWLFGATYGLVVGGVGIGIRAAYRRYRGILG